MAIYAGNGNGKTTVLEGLSLVGHLPCFPSLRVGESIQPSLLRQKWGGPDAGPPAFHRSLKLDELHRDGLAAWLQKMRPKGGDRYGMIEFELYDSLGASKVTHKFVVVVAPPTENGSQRLTGMLSRGDFDQRQPF
ncbi:hypothetical protein RM844_32815, partial [Streptomyces sp. DSM 44915]